MPTPRHRLSPRRRLQRSRLQHVQRLVALRGKGSPLLTKRTSRLWALASVSGLILLVLLLLVGRRYTTQKLNVEQNIRAQLIPALEKELGQKIEVGEIESDYFSRVVLNDVVIGRDKASPLGALAQAARITIFLDAVTLVTHRNDPLQAVSRVTLDAPQLYLARDARGRLNIANLLKSKKRDGSKWRGLVEINDGRLYFRDYLLHSASGQNILLDAQRIKGNARFNGADPIHYSINVGRGYAGAQRIAVSNIDLIGTAAMNGRWIALDANWPSAPAPLLTDWAFRKREVVAQKGTVGGRARLMWDAALPRPEQIVATGVVTLRGVDGYAAKALEPGTKRPLPIQNASGVVKFADRSFETGGLSLTALQTPLQLAGKFALTPLTFDVRAASNAFNARRLLTIFRATNRNPEFQRMTLQSSDARGEVRATGDARNWKATGALVFANANFVHPKFGEGVVNAPNIKFAVATQNQKTQINADFVAARGQYSSRNLGNWRASGNMRGNLRWSSYTTPPQLQVRFASNTVNGQNARFGAWRASGVSSLVRRDGDKTTAQVGAAKLAGRHPQAGNLGARNLNGTIAFSVATGNNFSAQGTATSALGNGAAMPALRGLNWQSGTIQSAVTWRGTRGAIRLNANSLRARQGKFGAGQFGSLRANVNFDTARGATTFATRFNARSARLQNPQTGNWRATTVLGVASGRSARSATPIQIDVEARDFSGTQNRYGSWNGNAVRVSANTPDANGGGWDGIAALGSTDVSHVNYAALSPALAERVRDVGVITAKARFTDLGASDPVIKGRARLSQVTLRQNGQSFPLREIETSIAFGGEQLRLAGMRAQSEFGPLQADAQSSLNASDLKLTLVAPRVQVSGAQINPYLAASGVRVNGNAVGRLRVLTTNNQGSNDQGSSRVNKTPAFQTDFDFALPRAQIIAPQTGDSSPIRVADARLRGTGNLNFASAQNWRFTGEATLDAQHIANAGAPTSPGPARAADFEIAARGTLARDAAGFVPNLRGEVRAANLSLPLKGSEIFALQNASAQFHFQQKSLQIVRFEAGAGKESKLLGHATLRQAATDRLTIGGQLLLEKFDAERAQNLLQNVQDGNRDFSALPQVVGTLFARADFTGNLRRGTLSFDEVGLQARLYRGRVTYRDNLLPVDSARLQTTLQFPPRSDIPIEEFVVWSRGARLSATGTVSPQDEALALNVDASLNTLRLEHLFNVAALRPALQRAEENGELDGLVSAQLHIGGTAAQPKVKGRAALKLAQAFGLDIDEATGNVSLETARDSSAGLPEFRLAVSDIAGVAEGAPFSGELLADSRANQWNLALRTDQNISTNRLLSVAQERDDVRLRGWRDLPLRGAVGGTFNLSGTLKAEDGSSRFAVGEGLVNLNTGMLRWRGRELGQLVADMRLQNGVLQARRFELTRAGEKNEAGARLKVEGVLPVALDSPDLSARVSVENERLSFVLEVLEEIRHSLAERGQNVAYLDAVLKRLESLPADIEGRFDLQAQLDQSWRVPVVEVRSLRAHEVFFQTEGGVRRRLPDVTARFTYDGHDNGAIAIHNAELRLPAESREPQKDADSEDEDTGTEDEDLLIRTLRPGRIVPGGALDLTAEILNADLQQLAQWVPGLRDESGNSAIKGRLSDFVLQLTGTMTTPTVTGSLQGENWEYRGHTLDRVRLSQFTIAEDKLQVERGALTVVKGDFQSDAAWGYLPWTWGGNANGNTETGVSFTRPLEIHLSVNEENLGALAGIFVPQIVNVSAQDFSGDLTIGGTLNAPQLTGRAEVQNGTFRWRSAMSELDAGVQNVSGALHFAEGNRLEFEGTGLSGKLVPADAVEAPTTGNEDTPARRERDEKRKEKNPPPRIAGDFTLRGGVALDLNPQLWRQPRLAVASQRYDLSFALTNASYQTPNFSGVQNLQALASWKTGEGTARQNQTLQWALTADGNIAKAGKSGSGRLMSFASLSLPPDFATSTEAFLSARANNFSGGAEFAALPELATQTAFQLALQQADGQPSQVELDEFRFDWRNVARGTVDGELTFDNEPALRPEAGMLAAQDKDTPSLKARVQQMALATGNGKNTPRLIQDSAPATAGGTPLRVRGTLTMKQAELFGAPQTDRDGGDGDTEDTPATALTARGVLARMPAAPSFAVGLVAGQDVEFVSSNLRATITGRIDVGGTPRDPVAFGTLFTRTGSITFPNARTRLESGEITFSARRDPATETLRTRIEIDATARGRTGRYEITLRVRGPLDTGARDIQNLRVDISSNPALSSDEAFARLLGTASLNRGDTGGQDEAYARALVGFLSGPLFSGLERTLERTLGLDTIALDYRVDEPIGVEIGKAIGDRMYISYRRALSRGPGEKTPFDLRIEYRIKGDLQLGLETDETDTRRITLRKSWRF